MADAYTNWDKIQHIPTFGRTNLLHVATCGLQDYKFLMLTEFSVLCRAENNGSLIGTFFLGRSDVPKLKVQWADAGFDEADFSVYYPEDIFPDHKQAPSWTKRIIFTASLTLVAAACFEVLKRA